MLLTPRPISFPPSGGDDYSLLIEKLAEDMYRMSDARLFDSILSAAGMIQD